MSFITNINKIFKKHDFVITQHKNDFVLRINSNKIVDAMFFLKDNEGCLFKMLIEIAAVDFLGRDKRFELVYCLLSPKYNTRLRVVTCVDELTSIESITSVYKSACWMEREIWDMNGIYFENHPDLRRILTDYGFDGYPLRKDFPLSGYVEVRYDDSQKRVIYENVELSQEYRVFNFKSSWE